MKTSIFAVLIILLTASVSDAAPVVQLAREGKAAIPIIVSEQASAATLQSAQKLALFLGKISGTTFDVKQGDGTDGIVIGKEVDFPKLNLKLEFSLTDSTRREEYLLRSHEKGLWLIGATDLACQHAVWDLLHRLGYRQFFPGETWEIIPQTKDLQIAVDTLEKPSYHARRIWYGFGPWDYAKEPYREWCEKNRCVQGLELHTGHAYDGIVTTLKKEFEAHPEYWPLLNGERKPVRNPKPCLGNPAVRKAMIQVVLERLEKKPGADSVSIDPSDGGGWCECEACAKLGSVTDQAITLANELAAAIQEKHPGTKVGLYAYNFHSSPANIPVHPDVIVSVATAFIKGGNSLDEILAGWAKESTTLGIREYYSVNTWDRDQPAAARGGNLHYLAKSIPEFHSKGARYMSAESSDNWGPNGLGYYFAARMLWDVKEAKRQEATVEDFLEKSFGLAKEPMREFYQQLDGSQPHLVADDQLGRMYRALDQARKLTNAPAIHKRLDELALYTRYASLYQAYAKSSGKDRQPAYEKLIKHAYRMRKTMLVHTYALYRDLAGRDKTVVVPPDAAWKVPEGKNPWKSSEPFTAKELEEMLQTGIAKHPLVKLDFKPIVYSLDLVPAAKKLGFPQDQPTGEWGPGRGVQTFFTYLDKGPFEIELQLTGGMIAHYRDRGNVKIELWKIGGASQTGEQETLMASDRSVPPDGKSHQVKLSAKEPGLYKLTLSDGKDRTLLEAANIPLTLPSGENPPMNETYGQWMAYFYVPKGTRQIGFFGGEHGEIRDNENRPQFWLNGRQPNYYSVEVPEGQDGKLWRVRYMRGPLRLLTVPSYFARTPQELLLPKEVFEKDATVATGK